MTSWRPAARPSRFTTGQQLRHAQLATATGWLTISTASGGLRLTTATTPAQPFSRELVKAAAVWFPTCSIRRHCRLAASADCVHSIGRVLVLAAVQRKKGIYANISKVLQFRQGNSREENRPINGCSQADADQHSSKFEQHTKDRYHGNQCRKWLYIWWANANRYEFGAVQWLIYAYRFRSDDYGQRRVDWSVAIRCDLLGYFDKRFTTLVRGLFIFGNHCKRTSRDV